MAKESENFTAGYGEDFSGRVYPLEAPEPAIGDDERLRLPVPTGEPYRLPAELAQPSATPKGGASPDLEHQWKEAARRLARGGIIYPDQEEQIERAARAQKSGVYDPSVAESLRNLAGGTAVQQYRYFTHPSEEEFTEPPPNWVQTDEFSPGRPGDQGGDPSPVQAQPRTPAADPRGDAEAIKKATGLRGTRMGGAWRNLPEDLRPEQLAGGLVIYPFERREYEARIQQAVQDGTVSPKVAKQVLAGYDKWKRTAWGAMVDHSRLKREEKHIGMEADADKDIIEERRAQQDEKLYEKLETSQREAQEAYEAERATYQESMAETVAAQEAAIENLARREIDPERWWNSQSNGRKVMSAIGVALGSLGSGLTGIYGRGTPNAAYDIMKSAINRDVTAQMADMRNRRAAVGARQSLLGTIMSQVKDAATAQSLTRMALLDQAKSKINMYAAGAQGDSARRNAEMLIGLVDNDREILWAQLRMDAHKLASRRAARVKPKVTPGRVQMTKFDESRYVRGHGIVTGGTPEQFKEFTNAANALAIARDTSAGVKKFVDGPGYVFSPTNHMLAQNIINSHNNVVLKRVSGGAVTDGEALRNEKGGITEEGTGFLLDAIRNTYRKNPQGGTLLPLDGHIMQSQMVVNRLGETLGLFEGTMVRSPSLMKTGESKEEYVYKPYFIAKGAGVPFAADRDERGEVVKIHPGYAPGAVPARKR